MKKFVRTIFMLFLAVFVLDHVASIVLGELIDRSNFRYVRVSKIQSNDYVILGNSRGVNSVNEKYSKNTLDEKVINLSHNGLTPKIINALLLDLGDNEVFKESKFIIELSSFIGWEEIDYPIQCIPNLIIKENEEVSNILLPFRKYFPTINQTYQEIFPLNEFLYLLNYNNEGFLRSLYYLNSADDEWINKKTIDNSLVKYYSNLKCIQISFDKDNFERILKSASDKNLDLVFFMAPWHPAYKEKFINYEMIMDLITKEYHVDVIRMDNLTIDRTFFADGIHTNINGSKFLSEELFKNFTK